MHVYERYVGLRGQPRIGLVDRHGRVHHYDVEEWERLMTEHDPTAMDPEEPLQGGDVDEPEPQDLPDKPDIEVPDNDEGDDPPTDDEEAEDEQEIEFLDSKESDEDDTVDNTEKPEEPVVFEPSEDDYEEVPED